MALKRFWAGGIAALVFALGFLLVRTDFIGPDQPVYFAYTASIVEDGDLNIFNQIAAQTEDGKKVPVSPTFHVPDFHNHGAVIAWAPFFLYAKLCLKLGLPGTPCGPDLASAALAMSTLLMGFAALLLTYRFCFYFYGGLWSAVATAAVVCGTPFYFFWLFETGNAQMPALLFSILLMRWLARAPAMGRMHFFWLGVFFSVCLAVKVDLWFHGVLIAGYLFWLWRRREIDGLKIAYLAAGVWPGAVLKIFNDLIKYGSLHQGELGLFNPKGFYLWEQLFSDYRGFVYTSPLLLLGAAGIALRAARGAGKDRPGQGPRAESFVLALGLYVAVKVFLMSFRFAWGGGTPGARQLMAELPVFALGTAALFAGARSNRIRALLGTAAAVFCAWNWMVISEYVAGVDVAYLTQAPPLADRFSAAVSRLGDFFAVRDLRTKLVFFWPVLAAGVFLAFKAMGSKPRTAPGMFSGAVDDGLRWLKPVAAAVFFGYALVTALNAVNSPRNVRELRDGGLLGRAEVLAPGCFEAAENLGALSEMAAYFSAKGDWERVQRITRQRDELAAAGK